MGDSPSSSTLFAVRAAVAAAAVGVGVGMMIGSSWRRTSAGRDADSQDFARSQNSRRDMGTLGDDDDVKAGWRRSVRTRRTLYPSPFTPFPGP